MGLEEMTEEKLQSFGGFWDVVEDGRWEFKLWNQKPDFKS